MIDEKTRRALKAAWTLLRYRLNRRRFRREEMAQLQLEYGGYRVSIERNEQGVPKITADSEAAVYFGQGYAVGADRLWQLDLLKRNADGRLSELFGAATATFDIYHRTLRLREIAKETLKSLDEGHLLLLTAFVAGINLAMERCRSNSLKMPFEFKLLEYQPVPWTLDDTVLVVKLMSLQLGMNVKYKAFMHELLKIFPVQQVRAIGAECGVGEFVTLTNSGASCVSPALRLEAAAQSLDLKPLLKLLGHSSATGSNALVVSGQHTESGYPLLANDPHLPFNLPATLHQSHLICREVGNEFVACGANVPGLPGVISGHNQEIAWGITNSQVDVQDLALPAENLNAAGKLFEERIFHEVIDIRGAKSVDITIEFTPLGPKLNHLCGSVDNSEDIVLAWSGLAPGADISGLFNLTKAHNWREFKDALRCFESLSLNFLFASRSGDIGFKTIGRVPLRASGLHHTPASSDWQGFVPFDALPELLNPASGIIVNANNPIADNNVQPLLTTLWNPSYRAQRMFALLHGKSTLKSDDLAKVQQDVLNLHAQALLPSLIELLNAPDEQHASAIETLKNWDCEDDARSSAPVLWHNFFNRLVENIYGEKFQEFLPYFEHKNIATTRLIKRVLAGEPTPWIENRASLARAANEALSATIVTTPVSATWGEHHRLGFKHMFSAALGVLSSWVDIPAKPMHGSNVTVALRWSYPRILEGAVWSTVVSFSAAQSASKSLLLPGQSGDFRSRWYQDQFQQCSVVSHRLPVSVAIAADNAIHTSVARDDVRRA